MGARPELPRIVLRPSTEADLDFVVAVESAPENARWVTVWSRERHEAALRDPDIAHRVIEHDGARAGYVIMAGLDNPHGTIEFRRIVVTARGGRIGRAAVRAVQAMAFEQLGAHRLWLDVNEHNTRARALYRDEGFVEEGTLRECLQGPEGREALVVMSRLVTEWQR